MATETKSNSVVKVKPSQNRNDSGSKGKSVLSLNKKKIESSSKQASDSKFNKSVTTSYKTEMKGKTSSSSSKTVTKTATVKKTEKKVYALPGQKYDPPEEREPLRIFYESLSKQIPSSEMAEFWMMEHGLLSPERAKKACERKQKRQQQIRMGTPIKSTKTERPQSSQKQQSSKNGDIKVKKRSKNYSIDDDDFVVKSKKSKW